MIEYYFPFITILRRVNFSLVFLILPIMLSLLSRNIEQVSYQNDVIFNFHIYPISSGIIHISITFSPTESLIVSLIMREVYL